MIEDNKFNEKDFDYLFCLFQNSYYLILHPLLANLIYRISSDSIFQYNTIFYLLFSSLFPSSLNFSFLVYTSLLSLHSLKISSSSIIALFNYALLISSAFHLLFPCLPSPPLSSSHTPPPFFSYFFLNSL